MSALTSLLVRDQRVSVRKIEEAIQRQVISGGGLDTVLLEMQLVAENVLGAYCAVVHGLLPATRDEVMRVGRDTIRIVPRDVAERHRLVPLSMQDRTLLVAVAKPLEPEADQQLSFLLGADIVQRVVPTVRVAAALQHHYGVEMVPRLRRLATKLRQRPPGDVPFVAPLEQNTAERTDAEAAVDYTAERRPDTDSKRPSVVPSQPASNESAVRVGMSQVVGTRRSNPPARYSSMPPPTSGTGPNPTSIPPAAGVPDLSQPPPAPIVRISLPQSDLLRKHRGPLTTRKATDLVGRAESRDEMLEVAFAFVRQFFDFTALFVVHDGEAEGLDCAGVAAPTLEAFQRVSIALDAPSAFGVAAEGLQPMMTHLDSSDEEKSMRRKLRRAKPVASIVVPVAIKRRVVLLFFGDRNGEEFGIADVPELLAFMPHLTGAFEQLILRRKFRGYAKTESTGEAREVEAPNDPSWEKTASPLPTGGKSTRPEPPKSHGAPASADPSSETPRSRKTTRRDRVAASAGEPAAAETPLYPTEMGIPTPIEVVVPGEGVVPGTAAPAAATKRHAVVPPPEATAPTELVEEEELTPSEPPPPGAQPAPGTQALPRRRRRKRSKVMDALGVPRTAPPPPRPGSQPEMFKPPSDPPVPEEAAAFDDDDEPEITVEEPQDISDFEDLGPSVGSYSVQGGGTEVVSRHRRSRKTPARAHSFQDPRADGASIPAAEVVKLGTGVTPAASPASQRARAEEQITTTPSDPSPDTPSVIVSMGENVEEAVADLNRVGPDDDAAIQRVLNLGEAALPVLVREFPGTLWFDRNQPHRRLPRGRDISAHARVLASFGERAVPYMGSLLDHNDADARFYATLVASETPHRDLVASLGRRVFDDDDGVAALAIDVLRMHGRFRSQVEKVLDMLRAAARVPRYALADRAAAAKALGQLRDQRSAELLVTLVASETDLLASAAYQSLLILTRQDFGRVPRRWQEWFEEHGHQHRVVWLIDSLLHADEKIRGAAGEELKVLTQQYYGYHPAHPKKQREMAQKKYRDWWKKTGQKRFATPAAS